MNLSIVFCLSGICHAAPISATQATTAPVVKALDYDSQVRELNKIRARLVMAQAGTMLPDGVWQGRTQRADADAAKLLAVKGEWWSLYTDVKMPEIMFHGAAWHKAAILARAWAMPQSKYTRSKDVLASIQAGLTHLQQFAYPDCPKPGNWWAWEIGMPMHVLDTLTLCGEAVEPALWQKEIDTLAYVLKVRDDLKLSGPAVLPLKDEPGRTDMNALWHARLCLQLALLIKNPAMAGKWAQAAMSEIGEAGNGCLQEDYSYKFHHGIPMWAYGRSFLGDYADLIDAYRGTAFGPSAAQIDRFSKMALHYANGFLYRGAICPAIAGRELTRGDFIYHDSFGPSALHALGALVRMLGPAGSAEMAAMVTRDDRFYTDPRIVQEVREFTAGVPRFPPAPPIDDIFVYPDSDFLQMTRPDLAIGIKMHSSRNRGYESINGENLQGWFLSHGSMFHLLTGAEWKGVWPAIDWTRLPGTTACPDVKVQNSSPFVGVLKTSPKLAMAAMELTCDKLHARKSWVVDGDCIVCLGSDIRGPGKVETTVFNQAVMAESVMLVDGKPMPESEFGRDVQPQWAWLEQVGYVFPKKQTLHVLRQQRSSDWTSVRESARHGAGERRDLFFLTGVLPHGPEQPDYEYVMLPNAAAERMPELTRQVLSRYRLESGGAAHQVAATDGSWETRVLWDAARDGQIKSDAGCLLLREGPQWMMADPTWTARPVHLVIGGQQTAATCERGRASEVKVR